MDKLWAERIRLSRAPYDEYDTVKYQRDWLTESSTRSVHKEVLPSPRVVLPPQARVAEGVDGYAWSAALGAFGGAGTVLLFAVLLFIFKRPKKLEPQLLAPMDVGQNLPRDDSERRNTEVPPDSVTGFGQGNIRPGEDIFMCFTIFYRLVTDYKR